MQTTAVVPLGLAVALLVLPVPVRAQAEEANLPVSLDRIRKALNEPPPRLQAHLPSLDGPTFRVEVHQYFSMGPPADDEPFDPTLGLPSVGELVMGGVDKLRSSAAAFKKARAQRRARREVAAALAAFCAEHDCHTPSRK